MKKIIEETKKEVAEYYSDFTNERFEDDIPEVYLKIDFNYGSKYDGGGLEFHLTDNDMKDILSLIKSKLSKESKNTMRQKLKNDKKKYYECADFRDWDGCEIYGSTFDLYNYFIYGK